MRATGEGRYKMAAISTYLQVRVASKAELEISQETTLEKTTLEMGKSRTGERAVRFSAQKTKVGTDCRRARATALVTAIK